MSTTPPSSVRCSLRVILAALALLVLFAPGARGVAASAAWNGEPHALERLTVVLQSQENSCGPAALATLSHWLGVPRTETELVALAELGPTGLTLSEFARLAHQVGLSGAWYQVRSSELQLVPAPFVAHLQAEGSAGLGHLVAVAGVAHGYVAVADPAAGAHVVPVGTFARRFTGRVYVLERRP